ncbi:MAG TPA: hypothetical protein VE135_02705 [Pyrinomonadaceae bacterium]|nr:hypothetical protein [Pyrinomonadaceae bacterium]
MTKSRYLTFASVALLLASNAVLAQSRGGGPEEGCAAATGCASCGSTLGCGVFAIFIYLLLIFVPLGAFVGLCVFIIKWIKRDATARGMPNADSIKWWGLLNITGLIIYLLQRSQGNLVPCPSCGQQRMQGLPVCPHCEKA